MANQRVMANRGAKNSGTNSQRSGPGRSPIQWRPTSRRQPTPSTAASAAARSQTFQPPPSASRNSRAKGRPAARAGRRRASVRLAAQLPRMAVARALKASPVSTSGRNNNASGQPSRLIAVRLMTVRARMD